MKITLDLTEDEATELSKAISASLQFTLNRIRQNSMLFVPLDGVGDNLETQENLAEKVMLAIDNSVA